MRPTVLTKPRLPTLNLSVMLMLLLIRNSSSVEHSWRGQAPVVTHLPGDTGCEQDLVLQGHQHHHHGISWVGRDAKDLRSSSWMCTGKATALSCLDTPQLWFPHGCPEGMALALTSEHCSFCSFCCNSLPHGFLIISALERLLFFLLVLPEAGN